MLCRWQIVLCRIIFVWRTTRFHIRAITFSCLHNIAIAHDSFGNLQPLFNNELLNINNWLVANKLSLNVAKTEFMVIGSRQKLLTQANYPVDNNEVKRVSKSKASGIMIDENLS